MKLMMYIVVFFIIITILTIIYKEKQIKGKYKFKIKVYREEFLKDMQEGIEKGIMSTFWIAKKQELVINEDKLIEQGYELILSIAQKKYPSYIVEMVIEDKDYIQKYIKNIVYKMDCFKGKEGKNIYLSV